MKSVERTIPAPIGGWNARDPLNAMKATDAVILDNYIPGTGGVTMRNGHAVDATGMPAPIESLFEYRGPSGGQSLFAASGTSVYNVTAAGAVGAAVRTATGNARFQHTMFANAAGSYLVIVNGELAVQHYDGTSWSASTITGVSPQDLIHVALHGRRLWFVEKNSLRGWYLEPDAIEGAATEFDIGPHCSKGGSLLAIASWTRDGGTGADDVFVFITDAGQVVLYSGTDPDSAETWTLVGTFQIPRPIGRRCIVKFGADLAVITAQGLLPLSTVLTQPASDVEALSITNKINGAFVKAYAAFGNLFGWQVLEYSKGGLLIVNVPRSDGTTSVQFVMNMLTGAWCRFTNINAVSMSLLGDNLYFGKADGKTYRFSTDYLDVGTPVSGIIFPAFSSFKSAAYKLFKMAKPLFTAVMGTVPPVTLRLDYDDTPPSASVTSIPVTGSLWDVSAWDEASWGAPIAPILTWQSIGGGGYVGSVAVNVSSETENTLNQIDVIFEVGGPL